MLVQGGEEIGHYAEAVLPLLISMLSQTHLPPGIRDNSTITVCRFCLFAPASCALVKDFFGALCLNVGKLADNLEKQQAARGLCQLLNREPSVFPSGFPQFAMMVASWGPISDLSLGQMLLNVLNAMKECMGSEWRSYYEQHVDLRFRQILLTNFGFE